MSSVPKILEFPGGLSFVWTEEQLTIKADRFRNHTDGRVTGELLIQTTCPTYDPHLHQAKFNFSDSQPRQRLAKQLGEVYEEAEWTDVLEQVCVYVLKYLRLGEPVKEIWSTDDIAKPQYLLYPIIEKGQPTIIFGDGGSGKSYFGLLIAVTVSLPWEDNPLGLIPSRPGHLPLYLDWEADENTLRYRLQKIVTGCELPAVNIHHRFCSLPLADDIERIRDMIGETKAEFLILDSLGAAAGGDLNTAECALRFLAALRQLKVTSFIIAHNSKDMTTNSKSIFGSVFFRNGARLVDELKSCQEPGRAYLEMALFARKANNSGFHKPLGFRLDFEGESVKVTSWDIRTTPELAEHLSLKTRIVTLLRGGAANLKDIAEGLAIPADKRGYLSVTLSRMKTDGQVNKLPGDLWGLAHKEEN